jgi:hypothetical protein
MVAPVNKPAPATEDNTDGSTATLRWAVRLLLVQAAGLAVVTLLLVYLDVTAKWTAAEMALSTTGYLALMTVAFGFVGISLARRRRWARGPAIVIELLQVPIGYTMLTNGLPVLGVPILVLGLVGAGLLLAPATRQALGLD